MGLFISAVALAEDNTTLLINGTTTNIGGSLVIGSTGTNNSLVIINGGSVTNASATIGSAATADRNFVIVSNTGSLWFNSNDVVLGSSGAENRLSILDGGVVDNNLARVGLSAGAVGNVVLIDGIGSLWNVRNEMRFGENAGFNTLIITNGGLLVNGAGAFHGAIGVFAGASNNTVLVTGVGSRWTNNNSVVIGSGANNNTLTIADGGLVSTPSFLLASSSNTVVVTGSGSMISNSAGGVTVGNGGVDNLLVVTNNGLVRVVSLTVGNAAAASNNTLLVTGPGSAVNLSSTLTVGNLGGNNRAIIQDGATVNAAVIGRIGLSASGSNNTIIVDDATLTIGGELRFGENAGGNTLVITNGGLLVNGAGAFQGAIGVSVGAGNNTVIVTGTGSRWTNSNSVAVGSGANNNTLTIADGGLVSTPSFLLSTSSNTVVVTGNGSMISNSAGGVTVGNGGRDNLLVVTNGGEISVASITVGNNAAASNNTLLVTGPGTEVNLSSTLLVGNIGPHNAAIIRDGAVVNANSIGRVGLVAGGSNNTILVDDATLNIGGEFRFGENAGGNTMVLTNGATLVTGAGAFHGAIGVNAGVDNNTVLVTGGSVWSNVSVRVGQGSSGNRLTIADGGTLVSTGATFSGFVGVVGSNNVAVVTGSGSMWTNTTSMLIGSAAHHSLLVISNGAAVYDLAATIGNSAGASNNLVVVTGAGSIWGHGVGLTLNNGVDNRVEVRDGGAVVLNSGNVNVGFVTNSSGSILVTGQGSILRTPGTVAVGSNATTAARGSGSLLVTDGGTVEAGTLVSGVNNMGTISNVGGIYQFSTSSPTVTTNTANSIAIDGGTISYRTVTNANIFNAQVARISFAGDNAFRLNNASNSLVTYTFDSVANTGTATNYQRLVLTNNSLWRGGNLTIGTGGAIQGGSGDEVQLTGNFIVNQTNALQFSLSASTVSFIGGADHTNAVTGLDLGSNEVGFVTANFSYGGLRLGSSGDDVFFSSGDPSASSNALYVLRLDLPGNDTNLVANLHSPTSINVYYGHSALVPGNAYLNNLVYTLPGGGLLIPVIPEPSSLVLAIFATCGLLAVRRARSVR